MVGSEEPAWPAGQRPSPELRAGLADVAERTTQGQSSHLLHGGGCLGPGST
jgi:hypothetical protein